MKKKVFSIFSIFFDFFSEKFEISLLNLRVRFPNYVSILGKNVKIEAICKIKIRNLKKRLL